MKGGGLLTPPFIYVLENKLYKQFMNKLTFLALLLTFAALACKKSDSADTDIAPTNLTLTANVSTDSSGAVSFVASATGAVVYNFDFGNSSSAVSATGVLDFHYSASGMYTVTVVAKSAGGKTSSVSKTISVTVVQGMVWSEEFDLPGSPDPAKWGYDIGANNGWGNNEKEYYTDRTDNSFVSDGTLKIVLKKESFQGSSYTSARLLTKGKFSFKYGTIKVRAKLPAGGGTWPAIWMLGDNISTVSWPACGEIDIMEHVGSDPNKIHGSLHDPSSFGNTVNTGTTVISNATTEFHVYSTEWSAATIRFFVDDVPYYTFGNNGTHPFNQNFFIIMNVAIGGNFGGAIDPNFTSGTMEVDYVRVYQ
jgi:beta-glucanase (GH16 family)